MNFTTIIKENIGPLLKTYGFIKSEETNGTRGSGVTYASVKLNLSLGFTNNTFEGTYTFWIITDLLKDARADVGIENFLLEEFLGVKRNPRSGAESEKIIAWTTETLDYFEKYKDNILTGDLAFYGKLNGFMRKSTIEYNKKMQGK